jgi:hypothetical protein
MIGLLMLAGELIRGAQASRLQLPVRRGPMAPPQSRTLACPEQSLVRDTKQGSAGAPKPAAEAPALPRKFAIQVIGRYGTPGPNLLTPNSQHDQT